MRKTGKNNKPNDISNGDRTINMESKPTPAQLQFAEREGLTLKYQEPEGPGDPEGDVPAPPVGADMVAKVLQALDLPSTSTIGDVLARVQELKATQRIEPFLEAVQEHSRREGVTIEVAMAAVAIKYPTLWGQFRRRNPGVLQVATQRAQYQSGNPPTNPSSGVDLDELEAAAVSAGYTFNREAVLKYTRECQG